MSEPAGPTAAAVGTGRLTGVGSPAAGLVAHLRDSNRLVCLRLPFVPLRGEIDDVERGSQDPDRDPAKARSQEAGVRGGSHHLRRLSGRRGGRRPRREHLRRLLGDGEIIWAPAIDGAVALTTRGGDFDLHLGTDDSIGYESHDAQTVQLSLQETLTFLCHTTEAAVALNR